MLVHGAMQSDEPHYSLKFTVAACGCALAWPPVATRGRVRPREAACGRALAACGRVYVWPCLGRVWPRVTAP